MKIIELSIIFTSKLGKTLPNLEIFHAFFCRLQSAAFDFHHFLVIRFATPCRRQVLSALAKS